MIILVIFQNNFAMMFPTLPRTYNPRARRVPSIIKVTDTHDSGPGSFRHAVSIFNKEAKYGGILGVGFYITEIDPIQITIESDIVIENIDVGPGVRGWFIEGKTNQTVTIQGNGKLIIKCAKVKLGNSIICLKQPVPLVDLAIAALVKSGAHKKAKIMRLLPIELRERINAAQESDSCTIV